MTQSNYDVTIFNLNNYVVPNCKPSMGNKYILNGNNNSFFQYIKERYIGSPTNAAIINSYVNYIIGQGLVEKSDFNVNQYISKRDVRLICQDFKMYGQFTIEVVWSQGSKLLNEEKKPIKFKHINTEKVGLSIDNRGKINGYWYSFDWTNQQKYKPQFFNKFTGEPSDNDVELITFCRISSEPYFPQPDYLSGLQYAHQEEELSNSGINHIMNGFSGGTVVNCKGGIPATEEERQRITKKIEEKLTGSSNQNRLIVSFSNGLDAGNDIEVNTLQVKGLDAQLVYFSEEAQNKLLMSHSVVNPILFGAKDSTGLSNNADEMKQALKTLYRSNINPMREVIIDSLEWLFRFIKPETLLEFKDFDELMIKDDPKNDLPK